MKRWSSVLALALILGALSPFASSFPDGLEYVAQRLGFAGREGAPLAHGLLPGYAVPGHEGSRLCGGAIGILGTLLVFVLAYALGRLLQRRDLAE